MKRSAQLLDRYTTSERVNHWLVALTFILLALSGLALFYPPFFPLSDLLGGGVWSRILHPFIGVALAVLFAGMFFRFRKICVMEETDWQWLRFSPRVMRGDDRNVPEAGKLNGGQKLLFWLLVGLMVLLAISGIVIWRAYFSHLFPVFLVRLAAVAHAGAGAAIITLIIGHIYLAIWTRESIGAMLYGTVRKAWAKQHHPAWYREMTGEGK